MATVTATAAVAAEIAALIERYQGAVGPVRSHSTVAELLRRLGELPVMTVELAAAHLDRSFEATNKAITRLVEVGALRQSTVRRNRIFEAVDILDFVTNAERRMASPDADTRVSPPARRVPHQPANEGEREHVAAIFKLHRKAWMPFVTAPEASRHICTCLMSPITPS